MMKKLVCKMVEIVCVASLAIGVNTAMDNNVKDTQVKTQVQEQKVDKKEVVANKEDDKNGVLIESKNWLNKEDDENNSLDGNVVIEDGKKVIEISSMTYNEIEEGENSDLEGDIFIDEEDIISSNKEITNQVASVEEFKENFSHLEILSIEDNGKFYTLNLKDDKKICYDVDADMFYVYALEGYIREFECINDTKDYIATIANNTKDSNEDDIKYTQGDYDRYLEYKEGLIKEHGQEIYDLMNVEAGIKNEEESFIHFMKYGK